MNTKELCTRYIAANKRLSILENRINDTLVDICGDNQLFSLVPEDYKKLLDSLVKETLGAEVFDWLEWWIYDAKQENFLLISGINHKVNSFDELWELVLKEIVLEK